MKQVWQRIGLVVAVELEMDALYAKYGEPNHIDEKTRTLIYQMDGFTLFVQHSGAGEIFAAAATQLLISVYNVDLVANYGVVGGLTEEAVFGKTYLVDRVLHYDRDTSQVDDGVAAGLYPEYPTGIIPELNNTARLIMGSFLTISCACCASGEKFMGTRAGKTDLHAATSSSICDMESAGIALICGKNHVPCLIVKTVSDGLDDGSDKYWNEGTIAAMSSLDALDNMIRSL